MLILGGTGWLSGRIAARALEAGVAVTCLSRGERHPPEGTSSVRADRDRADAYDMVSGRSWDHIVDVSSRADHVAAAIDALGDRTGRWTYVSSVSAYADDTTVGADEAAALHAPAGPGDGDDYGAQKAASEASVRRLGERALILRPGLIVGTGDPSDRFGYWAAAFLRAADGPVLLPPTADRETQVIDVEDLAAFVVGARATGVLNAVGDRHPLADVLALFDAASGQHHETVPADEDALVAAGVSHWMGERSLPLWLPPDMPGFMTRSNERYREAGGMLRPLEDTIAAVTADEQARGVDRPRRAGLTRAEELALIDALRAPVPGRAERDDRRR